MNENVECLFDERKVKDGGSYCFICNKCNNTFIQSYYKQEEVLCPVCNPTYNKYVSNLEKEIRNYIREEFNLELICNNKSIIKPKEIDIYIPEIRLAIEVNGIFWHTAEKGKGREYHQEKVDRCKEKNIELVFIWEDEWYEHKQLIMNELTKLIIKKRSDKLEKKEKINDVNFNCRNT